MGKGWKKAAMMDVAQKKGKIFTKLAREIYIATKLGGPDPEGNPRLKIAMKAANAVSCPKTTVERAIKKGSGGAEGGEDFQEITYEGQGPYNVGIIVECQSDNRNRTVTDIRTIFNKNGGKLGDQGSSAWMFDRVSYIEGSISKDIDPEEEAIEAGANDVEKGDEGTFSFYGQPEDLNLIRDALIQRGWEIENAELSYKAKNITALDEGQKMEVMQLLEALEDNDDSHRVHATID